MIKACIECGNDFEFKTHNQKYCSQTCCRISTNKRIMEKYYAKKERLAGKQRLCSCGSPLSMHNPDSMCILCQNKKKQERANTAKEAIKSAIVKATKTKSR